MARSELKLGQGASWTVRALSSKEEQDGSGAAPGSSSLPVTQATLEDLWKTRPEREQIATSGFVRLLLYSSEKEINRYLRASCVHPAYFFMQL